MWNVADIHQPYFPVLLFYLFLCYFPKVVVTSSYFDYYEDAYKNILSQAVFNKNHTANFIDSSNFCYSKNNTAYSSGPIPEYRWFWCIYFRYLEQCWKRQSWFLPILELALHPEMCVFERFLSGIMQTWNILNFVGWIFKVVTVQHIV